MCPLTATIIHVYIYVRVLGLPQQMVIYMGLDRPYTSDAIGPIIKLKLNG